MTWQSTGAIAGMCAVVIVAITQLYTSLFIFRPIERKTVLEEKSAKLNIANRAANENLGKLRTQAAALTAERKELALKEREILERSSEIQRHILQLIDENKSAQNH